MTYEEDDHSYKKHLRRDSLYNRKKKSKKVDLSNDAVQQKKNFKTKKRQIEDEDSLSEWENWKDNY